MAWRALALLYVVALAECDDVFGKSVVVVGAGMSGLGAARKLADAGFTVTVVEARARLGGRVHTDTTSAPGVALDLGASWIHGASKNNPLVDLAKRAGASTKAFTLSGRAYWASGVELSAAEEARQDALLAKMENGVAKRQNSNKDASLLASARAAVGYEQLSARDRQLVDFNINSNYEQEYSGAASDMSTWWFDNDEAYPGADAVFTNAAGYSALPAFLAQGLDVRFGHVVTSVSESAGSVTVAGANFSLSADHVVVTLPLGVLKSGSVRFSPALSSAKQQAISKLGVGLLDKVALVFDHVFWREQDDWIEFLGDAEPRWQFSEWVSLKRATGKNVLMAFNAANAAKQLEQSSDAELVAQAMAALRKIYGAGVPNNPVRSVVTRWSADPFARGSYSFNALGSSPSMRTALAATSGKRVLFAGEACHNQHSGTVHGAYETGLAAATKLIKAAGKRSMRGAAQPEAVVEERESAPQAEAGPHTM
jgi:monoamine oxidase